MQCADVIAAICMVGCVQLTKFVFDFVGMCCCFSFLVARHRYVVLDGGHEFNEETKRLVAVAEYVVGDLGEECSGRSTGFGEPHAAFGKHLVEQHAKIVRRVTPNVHLFVLSRQVENA